ncbi:DNA polymerase III subunit epsilon [Sphingomonas sp. QA11]|jgi:DNA polymerase-3 subunit epsilon|uniref:DNA polymerase III subunit epsilon n=1 Tax=hydrothermal vent metagenome TaxID=652676 RepID=A0A160TF54_9ZZZZ|nr:MULTISPECIES: DNA polymerase III subunit epsilon [unclassified Sphingomonas]WCM26509.1 DNA polymerase III subunit epsilon [Sphingomonas sp. QA11]WEJ98960.1 MAG: DNA polymerase III subunit epsilon [Sphingomonas sp.]
MREIVFDTETTGFSFADGDRMVEIGCVEVVNRVETGRTFHAYFHPERTMPAEAQRVHGLSDAFLSDKPLFAHGVDDLLEFLGDSPLVAHNASFDFGFLNGELVRCGRKPIHLDRMVDTIVLARTRHPGAKHSLDALCSRYGIDRSHRVVHGALLDAQLLSQVYVELTGGRQIGLTLVTETVEVQASFAPAAAPAVVRPARLFEASAEELARHAAFMEKIKNPLWGVEASG